MKNPTSLALIAAPFALFVLVACADAGPNDSAARITKGVFSANHASAQYVANANTNCDPSNRACSDGERGLHRGADVRSQLAASDTGHITKGHLGADIFADQEMATADDAQAAQSNIL